MGFSLKGFAKASTSSSEEKAPVVFEKKVINRPKLTEAQKQEMIEKRQSNIAPFRLTALKPNKGKEELRKQFTISSSSFDALNLQENEVSILAGMPVLVVVTKGNGDYYQSSKKSKTGNKSRTVIMPALLDILEEAGEGYLKPSDMKVNDDYYYTLEKVSDEDKNEFLESLPEEIRVKIVDLYGIVTKALSKEEQDEVNSIKKDAESPIDFSSETVTEFDSLANQVADEEVGTVDVSQSAAQALGLSFPAGAEDDLLGESQEI